MKKTVYIILFSFFVTGLQETFSQCSINQYIEENYLFDAKILALREIISNEQDPDYNEPFIPEDRYIPYLEKLSAIYENPLNEPLLDSLFQEFNFHVHLEYNHQAPNKIMMFMIDNAAPWLDDFMTTGISGLQDLDDLMIDNDFSIDYVIEFDSSTLFALRTGYDVLNMKAIEADFMSIEHSLIAEGMADGDPIYYYYTGIPYTIQNPYFGPSSVELVDIFVEGDIFHFFMGGNDCMSGCQVTQTFSVEVTDDCEVNLLSIPNFDVMDFVAYPNPTSGVLHLQTPAGKTPETIILYDMQGKRLLSHSGGVPNIDLSLIPAGIYFLHLKSEGHTTVKKVIKN
jgi:hypothetical protein